MDDIDRLFHTYHESVTRYIARRLGDRDLADELAGETFVRAARHLPLRNEKTWLFSVATNLVRDEVRRHARQRRDLEALRAHADAARHAEHPTSARDEQRDPTESEVRAQAALDALAQRDRAALLLAEEGLDYREIAMMLNLAVGSVGTTLTRARRRLVDHYEALQHERAARGGADVA
jgi:RNA polymerase sigma-70 factor (ECF subfamily)